MERIKTVMIFLLTGMGGGSVLAGPMTRSWAVWHATPGAAAAMCDCQKVSKAVADNMLMGQAVGVGVGALLGLVLGVVFVRWRGRRAKALVPVGAPAPAKPTETPQE